MIARRSSQAGAAPAGTALGPLTGQGSALGSRAPKRRRLLRVVDDDDEEEEEEEAASTLVCKPRSRSDVALADGGRTIEDPPIAHVEQACNTLGVKHALSLINPFLSILLKHSIT